MIGYGGRTRWMPAELRDTSPAVVEAARWELYADRIWPAPDVVVEIEADDRPKTETQLRQARVNQRKALRALRTLLLPPDEVT